MNALWSYFWPVFGAAVIAGVLAGSIAYRRPSGRNVALAVGVVLSIGLAALWHGPLGAADRFAATVERNVRTTLVNNEIPQVVGHIQRGPLSRRVFLSGPADDFQRGELLRIVGGLPGVSRATWSSAKGGVPLIGEACIVAVLGFLLGLLLAYLIELRRRYNAQWKW
jgi:hypothetical protein